MRIRLGSVLAALVLSGCALLLGGCGSAGFGGARTSQDSQAIHDLRAATTRHEIEIERLRREVARLSLELEAYQRVSRAPAKPSAPAAPAAPAPRVESSDLAPSAPLVSLPAAPSSPPVASAGDDLAGVTDAAQAIYDQGYALYHQNRYLEAETAFQRFLSGWGTSSLADNALFWIGACRLARGENDTALAAFREVASRYPEGNKVPDALLKVAEIAERAGDAAGAIDTYRQILTFYPDSAAATAARERIPQR